MSGCSAFLEQRFKRSDTAAFPEGKQLIFLRPLIDFTVFYKVTESAPLKLPKGDRAFEFDLVITNPNNLPVTPPWPGFNVDFLPCLKGIGSKQRNFVDSHGITSQVLFGQRKLRPLGQVKFL
jgi:hypothetical protein